MKKIKFYIFFSTFFSILTCLGQKQSIVYFDIDTLSDCYNPIDPNDSATIEKKAISGTFYILEIDKIKNGYIIMTAKDSLLYQIVSLTSKNKSNKKINIGDELELLINPYFKNDCFPDGYILPIVVRNKTLHIGKRGGLNIYTTPNINGLYYIPRSAKAP